MTCNPVVCIVSEGGFQPTNLKTQFLHLNIRQSDGFIVFLRLLHQETLLHLVFLYMVICGWKHHCGLNLWKIKQKYSGYFAFFQQTNVAIQYFIFS